MQDITRASLGVTEIIGEGGDKVYGYMLMSGLFALFGFIFALDYFNIDFGNLSIVKKLGLGGVSGSFGLMAAGLSQIYVWFDSLMNGTAGWGVTLFFIGLGFYLLAMLYSYSLTKGVKLAADSVDYLRAHRHYKTNRNSRPHRTYGRTNHRRRR